MVVEPSGNDYELSTHLTTQLLQAAQCFDLAGLKGFWETESQSYFLNLQVRQIVF